jgi:transposase
MFIRTVSVKKKTNTFRYVQLVHNYRDPKTGVSKSQILYNFGRADKLDLDAIRRLIKSLAKLLAPEEAVAVVRQLDENYGFEFLGSRQFGDSFFLDGLWKKLKIDSALKKLLTGREYQIPVERLIFAMVANRALAPSSKLGMEHWVKNEVLIDGLPEIEVHQLYRAMDFLMEASSEIQREVFFSVANLFNLEVDLIFLDTTTTYFEIAGEDEADGIRRWGYSKDNHPELAQVVIAFAVTRTGIPVKCWVWPGNTADQDIVGQVKHDLNDWNLGRVVLVQDTGFNSERNRRILQGAGGHYIIGEKMRLGRNGTLPEALTRGGKYQKLANGLEAKEVIVGGDSEARRRFVIVRNPEEATRDKKKRDDILQEVERRLHDQLSGQPHKKATCKLRSHDTFGKYLRQTKTGELRLNKAKVRAEEHLDGKYLISTSDDNLSVEDIVLGYKQLFEIERVFRDMKHLLDIRPVYHRLPERIKSHVLLCWLAMLLIRVAENQIGQTWRQMKKIFSPIQVGIHSTDAGEIWQTNPVSKEAKGLFEALDLKLPPKIYALKPASKT